MTLPPVWRRGIAAHGAARPKAHEGLRPSASGRTIDSRRLKVFAEGALAWLARHRALFDPFNDGPEPVGFHSRAFLELSYLTMLYLRRTTGIVDPSVRTFLRLIQDVWERPQYRECIVRYPERLAWYLMPYLVLLRAGRSDRSYRTIVQRMLAQGYVTAIEDVSFNELARRHLLESGGFRHDLPSYQSLYRNTLLARTPPLPYLTRYDVACITHALFALSDLGSHPIEVIPARQWPAIRQTVGALLGIYSRLEDWDVVGELLLSCLCLRWAPPIVFEAAWNAFLRAQLPDGAVPGRAFSARTLRASKDGTAYRFKHNYHPTLVGALTAFLSKRWIASL